jgi:hypothetical protein
MIRISNKNGDSKVSYHSYFCIFWWSIDEYIVVPLKIVAFTFGVSAPSSGQSATGCCVSCGWQWQTNTGVVVHVWCSWCDHYFFHITLQSVCAVLHLQSLLQGKPDITLCCVVGKLCSGKLYRVYVYVLRVLHVCTWMHKHFVLLHRYTVCNIPAVTMSRLFSHFVAESHCSLMDTCRLLKKLWQINFLVFGCTFTFLH